MLYGLCVMLGAAALILTYASSGQSALLLIVLALVALVFLRSLGYMRFDRVSASAVDRKRNRALRGALRPLGRRLRQAARQRGDVADRRRGRRRSWRPSASGCGGAVRRRPDAEAFSHGFDGRAASRLRRRPLHRARRQERASASSSWRGPMARREVDRDTEIAIDIFCEHLGDALELRRPSVARPARGPSARQTRPRQRPSLGVVGAFCSFGPLPYV